MSHLVCWPFAKVGRLGKPFLFLLMVFLIIVAFSAEQSHERKVAPGSFAVVELYTSQGCSSCPPADRLLSKIIAEAAQTGKRIYPLSFHVDYWNRLGWKDPFSQAIFSERQRNYAAALKLNGVYTPQMVVNGQAEFVGSNEKELQYALRQTEKEKAQATFTKVSADFGHSTVAVAYQLSGAFEGCKLQIALVSAKEVTEIKRGENGGRTLTNEHVVRHLTSINAQAEGRVSFPGPTDLSTNKANYSVILFVQQQQSLKIIGATAVNFQ